MARCRTIPRFLLTGKTTIQISRSSGEGEYVRGKWVESPRQVIEREVNIQPLQYHQVMLMPEAERSRQWYVLYCAEDLRAAQEPGLLSDGTPTEGWGGDRFMWEGHEYEIMKARRWQMGVLDHWEAQAARIPVTPN